MKRAIIMMGIQGSGKSEFCSRCLRDITRINLDTLKTRNNERRMLEECLAKGSDFVIDNTNPTKEDRARYIPKAKAAGYRVIGYYMQSSLEACMQRNNRRTGKAKVPDVAVVSTFRRLELPDFSEGFDELYYVSNDGTDMTVSEWRNDHEL